MASGKAAQSGGVCILLVEPVKKQPHHYKGKHCHPDMWALNYEVTDSFRVSEDLASRLEAGDERAADEIERIIRQRGKSGDFIVKVNRGGPGRGKHGFCAGIKKVGSVRIVEDEEDDVQFIEVSED